MTPKFGANPTGFLCKIPFWFALQVVFGHWACAEQAGIMADLGMAFMDDWVKGTVIG